MPTCVYAITFTASRNVCTYTRLPCIRFGLVLTLTKTCVLYDTTLFR
jgi:hypothetical protein